LTISLTIFGVFDEERIKGKVKTVLTDINIAGLNVNFIRHDDSGKNMTVQNYPEMKTFAIKFEFSGP
jgi:hypothetical protein